MKACEKYIAQWAMKEGSVTNWYWNDYYMDWCSKFYPEWSTSKKGNQEKLQRAFTYRANKLVDKGILKKCVRVGLGYGGESEFGVKTQSVWEYNYPF